VLYFDEPLVWLLAARPPARIVPITAWNFANSSRVNCPSPFVSSARKSASAVIADPWKLPVGAAAGA